MNCLKCHRPLRPRNSKALDWPVGTITAGSRGLCQEDYRRAQRDGTLDDWARVEDPRNWDTKPCAGKCGRIVRNPRRKAADFPGTTGDQGGGRCGPCRREQFHNGQTRTEDNTKTTEENRRALEQWLKTNWCPSKTVKVVRL